MNTYIIHYELLFCVSWAFFYFIFPSWALPVSVTVRLLTFVGLIIYFSLSAYIMHIWLRYVHIDKPVIIPATYKSRDLKNNIWLICLILLAVILPLYPITSPVRIMTDETAHLQAPLGIYVQVNKAWNKFSGLPIQYIAWASTGLLLLVTMKKKIKCTISKPLSVLYSKSISNRRMKLLFLFFLIGLSIVYFHLLKNLPFHDLLIRYPPVSKLLYLWSYLLLGITRIGPRIIQLSFYILSGIYLYRIILLFRNEKTAFLGTFLYLFSPLVFSYAYSAELSSGLMFFIMALSFYFLRFLKDNDSRDLLLSSYFISIGFLYKREILLMFFVCTCYLFMHNLYKKNLAGSKKQLEMLLISIFPIIPWMIIGKLFISRNYEVVWSHFISWEKFTAYFDMIPTQASFFIFILFLASILYFLVGKRDILSLFFGFLFLTFYVFYTGDATEKIDRFSVIFYPTIAVFIAQFLSFIIHRITWKHSFKIVYSALACYMILMCTIWQPTSLKADLVAYKSMKTRYFPVEEAMAWIKEHTNEDDRILILRVAPAVIYRDKYNIKRDRMINFMFGLDNVSTPEKLKAYCRTNRISYLMFSYNPKSPGFNTRAAEKHFKKSWEVLEYLKNNSKNEYVKLAAFNIGENYIYIYKAEKNSHITM
jgi:hypothetical protein